MANIKFDRNSKGLKLSEATQQALRKQSIDEAGPGTVLQDFEALLAFISEDAQCRTILADLRPFHFGTNSGATKI